MENEELAASITENILKVLKNAQDRAVRETVRAMMSGLTEDDFNRTLLERFTAFMLSDASLDKELSQSGNYIVCDEFSSDDESSSVPVTPVSNFYTDESSRDSYNSAAHDAMVIRERFPLDEEFSQDSEGESQPMMPSQPPPAMIFSNDFYTDDSITHRAMIARDEFSLDEESSSVPATQVSNSYTDGSFRDSYHSTTHCETIEEFSLDEEFSQDSEEESQPMMRPPPPVAVRIFSNEFSSQDQL